MTLPYGFRILGACSESRRLVDADAAFRAYAACDERAAVERESFLSAFTFGSDFRDLLESTGSCRGFDGACWSPWLWFDIDRDNLDFALADARRLASFLTERFRLDDDAMLLFYSGQKGFHAGLPTMLWSPEPSPTFHKTAKRFAERLAEASGIRIDGGVYDRVRAFRAPNSRHPKTGLHKRRLSFAELLGLSLDRIRDLARKPEPFDLPPPASESERAKADWRDALAGYESKARPSAAKCRSALNRATLDFIRYGAAEGERHLRTFQAAANLAEFGYTAVQAHALLIEAALDSGLPPAEARRQIECGLAHVGPLPKNEPPNSPTIAEGTGLQAQLAELWQRPKIATVPPLIAAAQNVLGASIIANDFPFGANALGPEGGRR